MSEFESIVRKYFNRNDFAGLARFLESKKPPELPSEEQLSWYIFRSLAARLLNDWEIEKAVLTEGAGLFPDSADLRYYLGVHCWYEGEHRKMADYFAPIGVEEMGMYPVIEMSRFLYCAGDLEGAAGKADLLLSYYRKTGILDDHYLIMNGMPTFGTGFGCFSAYHLAKGTGETAFERLDNLEQEFPGAYNFDLFRKRLRASVYGDWSDLAEMYGSSDDGLGKLESGVYGIRRDGSWKRAPEILTQIKSELSEYDDPYLPDIIKLLKAEAFFRSGREDEEEKVIRDFLENRPMLMEPDLAFHFGAVPYQERVKLEYGLGIVSRLVHPPVTPVPQEEPAEPAGPESGRRWLNEVLSCGYSYLGGADTGVLKSALTVDLDPDMLLESPEGAAVICTAEIYRAVFGKKIPELNENTVPGDIPSRDEITPKDLENASKAVQKTGQNGSALDMIMEERGEDHYREWHGYLRELQEDLLAESSKS